jgi:hypothetical protein
MARRTVPYVLCLVALLSCATRVSAQTVVNPSTASFTQTPADIAATVSVQLDFFQCASLAAGVCVGQAATPFQAGALVPAASITTLATPDSFGNNRVMPLTAAPQLGLLQSAPAGVPFVATLIANGDPNLGAGASARSAASNGFFPSARPLGVATNVRVR